MAEIKRFIATRTKKYIPPIPVSFFYLTLFGAVIFMIFLSVSPTDRVFTPSSKVLLFLTYWLDPLACQLATYILVVWVVYSYYRNTLESSDSRKNIILAVSIILPIIVMYFELFAEKFWLKPAFGYDRPFMQFSIPEPPLTELFEDMLLGGADDGTGTSAPSGFAIRQILLLLLGVTFALREYIDSKTSRKRYIVAYVGVITLTTIVIFSRVYRVRHTVFDIGIAFGVAVYLFWLVYTIFVTLFDIQARHFLTDITGASLVFLPLFFFYSQSAKQWTLASVFIFAILGLVHYISPIVEQDTS